MDRRNTVRELLATACLIAVAGTLRAQDGLAQKSQQAKQAMDDGRFPEAAALYRELVRALPDEAGLRLDLGLALHSEGKYRDAVAQFQTAVRRQPDLEPAWLMLGVSYLELNQPRDAIDPLLRVLKADPKNERAQLQLGEAQLAVGRPQEARELFERVTKEDPGNPKAWQSLGMSYSALSRSTFAELEKTDPDSPYRDALLAQSLVARDQDHSAFYWYREALARNDRLPGIHAALGEIYRRTGHPDWASVEDNREREQGKPDCRRESLECDFLAGQFTALLSVASRAHQPDTLYWKARAYEQLSAQALSHLAEMPPSPEIHELIAEAEVTKGDYRAAMAEWNEALKLAPEDAALKQGLAYALWLDGSYQKAEPLLEQIVEINPASAEVHFELGDSLLAMGLADRAILQLEEAVKIEPALAPAHTSLGRAYLRAGRPQDAVLQLKTAASGDGKALYELAQAYRQTGQKALAEDALRRFQQSSSAALARSQQMDQQREITAP